MESKAKLTSRLSDLNEEINEGIEDVIRLSDLKSKVELLKLEKEL